MGSAADGGAHERTPMRHPDRSSSGCGMSSNRARALATGNFACAAAGLALVCTKDRWVDGGGIALDLPSLGHDAVARVAVVDLDADRTLGDSAERR